MEIFLLLLQLLVIAMWAIVAINHALELRRQKKESIAGIMSTIEWLKQQPPDVQEKLAPQFAEILGNYILKSLGGLKR